MVYNQITHCRGNHVGKYTNLSVLIFGIAGEAPFPSNAFKGKTNTKQSKVKNSSSSGPCAFFLCTAHLRAS